MLWRHLCLVRAWSAAGLLITSFFGAAALAGEPEEPAPKVVSQTVALFDAEKAGDLKVEARGHGQEQVHLAFKNLSSKRLNVVVPPGLVAASTTGQAAGGRGGLQSMGVGAPGNPAGAFGQFKNDGQTTGLRSIAVEDESASRSIAVPPGQTVEINLPSVCLNFGLPSPTARDRLVLKDVDDYSRDPRVRKALRSLATYGTSHGVAQAVMWKLCNNLPFDTMMAQAGKVINVQEIALAARFVEAVEASNDDTLVDPAYLSEARLFVDVQSDAGLATEAIRLGKALDGLRMLGLPARVVEAGQLPDTSGPALLVNVYLGASQKGETRGKVMLSHRTLDGNWAPIGRASLVDGSKVTVLDGAGLARALDHAIAAAMVTAKPARRAVGSTTLRVENHLPFTIGTVVLRTGHSSGAAGMTYDGIGIGPGRAGTATVQAPGATVDRITLNGL
jgi:hypothetical protein